ncbi:MAG: hypothetical protein JWM16_3195, partial [Verrucomicrobiales bacterium]|nr:hypothetical protein [Verrucomicrobiales bacterium]
MADITEKENPATGSHSERSAKLIAEFA